MLDALYSHVCPHCGGLRPHAEGLPDDFDLEKEMDRIIQSVYQKELKTGKVDPRLAGKVAATVSQAVTEGYGRRLIDTDWETPDWEMIRNLQKNVYQFSFAKTYQQLKAINQALVDKDGHVVPFEEFKDIANRIGNTFNESYLRTEYNTAIASGQMGSRWTQFTQEQDIFPNLTYHTMEDDLVRPSHALLDKVTRPIKDTFWLSYYPPNGWNCRCDVEQSTTDRLTDPKTINYPDDIPKMFQGNLAAHGLTFPKDHPYFTHLPESVTNAADGHNPYLYDKIHAGKDGGYVYDNPLHKHAKGQGWADELDIATLLADVGERVIFLPEVEADTKAQKALRALILPGKDTTAKSADAWLPEYKKKLEIKSITGSKSSIDHALQDGGKKASYICLNLKKKVAAKDLNRAMKGRIAQSKDIEEVWILQPGAKKPTKYTRDKILNYKKSR